MPNWADLADSELRDRLLNRGVSVALAGFLVRNRDDAHLWETIDEALGEGF